MSASDLSQARMRKLKYFYTTPAVTDWLPLRRGLGLVLFRALPSFSGYRQRVLAIRQSRC